LTLILRHGLTAFTLLQWKLTISKSSANVPEKYVISGLYKELKKRSLVR
jgi:hypothetical protein